jgi:hypothetical protein
VDEMPTGEAMKQFHKPKLGSVKSPRGKVVSRRAPKGHSAAVTVVEQSSGIRKEL